MRYLFNHGVTAKELYTNHRQHKSNITCNKTIAVKIFERAFSIILNDIIDNKVRFAIPGKTSSYIDFKVFKDDNFIFHRNIGRFQDIDFIESDFMGYQMYYFVQGKAFYKDIPIYLGSELKRKFTNKINSGEKFYTVITKKLNDYLPEIATFYPNMQSEMLKKIISLGFTRMESVMRTSGAMTINSQNPNMVLHIGVIRKDRNRHFEIYNRCQRVRYRFLYKWNKTEFDGYYYIGVADHEFEKFIELNKVAKVRLTFLKRPIIKVKEELYCASSAMYIFRIKHEDVGYIMWKEKWYLREPEYYGKATKGHFERANMTWKQLIKGYETRK